MRLPRFLRPLRWFYDAHIWCFWTRVRFLRLFAYSIWHFDTCDYAPLLRIIHVATKEMARLYREHPLVVGAEKTAKQLTVVSELCKRLEADDYFENAGHDGDSWQRLPDHRQRQIAKHAEYMAKQDTEYLGKMLTRVRYWWQ
jgi:hypothetical protein